MDNNSKTAINFPQELIDSVKEMVTIKNPCFIFGSAGKTTFLKSIFTDILVYDSREIQEVKNLGGFYAIQDNELVHTEGILTDAMKKGQKICFKNIEQNQNLFYYLLPVINGISLVASNGQEITAHVNFRIFVTCNEILSVRNVAFIGPIQFTYTQVMESFGSKKESVENVLKIMKEGRNEKCYKEKGLECDNVCLKEGFNCTCGDFMCPRHFRMLCELRDTLNILCEENTSNTYRTYLNQCVVNVFLKHQSKEIAESLYLNTSVLSLPNMLFAKTHAVESVLKSLILNIKLKKPTLLVGETGAGKTALIQYLSANSMFFFNKKSTLKIINMSSDFDSADLIGGYQSIDFLKNISEIYLKAKLEMPKTMKKKALLENLVGKLKMVNNTALLQEASLLLKIFDKKVPFFYKEGILTNAMKNGGWILLDEVNLCSVDTLNLLESVLAKKTIVLYESGNFTPIQVNIEFMIFACMNPHGDFGKKQYDSVVFNKIWFYDFSYRLSCIRAVVQSITRNQVKEDDKISQFYFEFKAALSKRELTNIIEPLVSGRTLCRALNLILQMKQDKNIIYKACNLLFFTQLDLASRSHALTLFKKHFNFIQEPDVFDDVKDINGFIITHKVKIQINDVDLAIKANLPVLLQGDTSTGKTSLIIALASKYNRKVIRINNHNQTESSDYIGSYQSTQEGIRFNPGPLVTAMRKGYWVVLDELNLAPSDVLEVLNRLLDDNKELFVPEMDETITPHKNFRIFATQNINYGGRQGLAKSFRNRFIEIFFYEKHESDIKEILHKSYNMPPSFTKYMLLVYVALKTERTINSFISLRDVFKWAQRTPGSYYELFEIGLDIILERQRNQEDKELVTNTFKSVFADRFNHEKKDFLAAYFTNNYCFLANQNLENGETDPFFTSITQGLVITKSYVKLINLIYKAWTNYEPVLLIGETGIGKTKICEIVTALFKNNLRSINVHNGTESNDFIGHPVLEKSIIQWKDGPLVEALVNGDCFLIDEINLAEDSALERLNSVLETGRSLFIPEIDKEIKAANKFRIVATMNPSGDYGKRELSPALRSRFTEIYFCLEQDEYFEVFDSLIERCNLSKEYLQYFKEQFRLFKEISIRKVELVCNHIRNICVNNHRERDHNNKSFTFTDPILSMKSIWKDVLEILGIPSDSEYTFVENDNYFGVTPYYLRKKKQTQYSFESKNTKINLQRIVRGIGTNKGMLLEGEPGVGKTSIIQNIADVVDVPVIRINLSDQTEMSDLVGSYLPQGDSIKFVESEMIKFVKMGYWVILDEINLCTQSVIEGLNSMLDHRRSIEVDGKQIKVHKNTKIFGTMNPQNKENGRKRFPKSFLDRFIVITMQSYDKDDLKQILDKKYGQNYLYNKDLTLRGNIKYNELESPVLFNSDRFSIRNYNSRKTDQVLPNTEEILDHANCTDYQLTGDKKQDKTTYEFYLKKNCRVGAVNFDLTTLPSNYVILSSQIQQIDIFFRCLTKKMPVILKGAFGRNALLRFACSVFNLKLTYVDCHKDTDTSDLLGQYQKSEDTKDNTSLFEWKESILVKALRTNSMIVFNTPDLVEKSVFDRLNSLFENERSINVHEKGFDSYVSAHEHATLVLCCDNTSSLSPALIDRCVVVTLSDTLTYLDIYKIFISKKTHIACELKRFKSCFKDNMFADLIGTNDVLAVGDLDLEIKRFEAYKSMPSFMDKTVDITNTLNQNEILDMFCLPLQPPIAFDQSLLDAYKIISSVSTALPRTLTNSVNSLLLHPNIPTLVKSLFNLPLDNYFNCNEIPTDITTFKLLFIESLKHKTLDQIQDVYGFTQKAHLIPELTKIDFNEDMFNSVMTAEDPLLLIKKEITNEMISKENELKAKISKTAENIYKYGRGRLEKLFEESVEINRSYLTTITSIDNKLNRDYKKFLGCIKTITLCDYLNNEELRNFLEGFADIFDFYLIKLFNNRTQCPKCSRLNRNDIHSSKQCSLRLFRNNRSTPSYEKLIMPEYSKYMFEQIMEQPHTTNNLILEAICFNTLHSDLLTDNLMEKLSLTKTEKGIFTPLEFTGKEVDSCIEGLFTRKTHAQIIDRRVSNISIGQDLIPLFDFNFGEISVTLEGSYIPLESLRKLSIFSTPEVILNEIQEIRIKNEAAINLPMSDEASIFSLTVKKLNQLEQAIKNLYKKDRCLSYDKNYSFFQYLLFNDLTIANLENYFMNCCVYEFLERMFLAEAYLKYKYTAVLYNSILIYKSFEIEKLNSKKHNETKVKLYKEPKLYETTINLFVDRFLYIPALTVFKITFDIPSKGFACVCNQNNNGEVVNQNEQNIYLQIHKNLIATAPDLKCECDKWIYLSENISRQSVLSLCNQPVTKDTLINQFYYRSPEEKFSTAELCLGKLINNVVFNTNAMKYDQDTLNACYTLCICAIKNPSPAFIYFAYKFSNTFEEDNEVEEGVGLKAGTGENNMNDENIHESDICDEFDDEKNEDVDSEGMDMNNEGDLHSVSDQDDAEEGVDEMDNEEGVKDEGDSDERGEVGEELDPELAEQKEEELEEDSKLCDDSQSINDQENEEHTVSTEKDDNNGVSEDGDESCSSEADVNNDLFNYEYKESSLNRNQTCATSDGYSRKVEGGNLEQKDALKEGDGDEYAEGEGESNREGGVCNKTVVFNKSQSDCAKLTSLLRIALESNRNNKYKGDFKSGKKLNLKKIVPYIASDYRRDKIWMKRLRNDKKDYTLRIFIDNSKSMFDQSLIDALSTIYYKLENSFSLLDVPVELYKFGSTLRKCTVDELSFDEEKTVIDWTEDFKDGINLILTDGVFQSVGFAKDNFLVVMIDKGNIKKMSKVNIIENKVMIEKYLDSFALRYCVIQTIDDLEKTFIEALSGIIKDTFYK